MTDRSVHFDKLTISRMPGIQHGEGFELSDLSPGINVIHGPNGSGKSSTARVIQELLWPGRTGLERPTVSGEFREGERRWQVHLDAGHPEITGDGRTGTVPELGPPEHRHRYHLALDALMGGDNTDFAKSIVDASQGGYDLEAAAAALGFTERPGAPRKQAGLLKERCDHVEAARRKQRDVERDATQLDDLRRQRELATAAARTIELLEKAQEFQAARQRCERVKHQLAEIPPGVARLRGDEREVLDSLAKRQTSLQGELAQERDRLAQAASELAHVRLPEDGVAKEAVAALRASARRLVEVENDLRRHQSQLLVARTEETEARGRLGDRLTDAQLHALDDVEVSSLSAHARRADQVRAQQAVLDERRGRLDRDEPEQLRGLSEQRIREGLTTLSHWLTSPSPDPTPRAGDRVVALAAVLLAAALTIVLAVVHHVAWVLALGLVGGLGGWYWWTARRTSAGDSPNRRQVHQQSYASTGLPQPTAWDEPSVTERLRQLIELAADREREDERQRQLEDLCSAATALARRRAELEEQRRELERHLGLKLDLHDEWLPLLVDNIGHWQRRHAEAEAAQRILSALDGERQQLLHRINERLQPFGYAAVDAAEGAAQLIDDLEDRRGRHTRALQQRDEAQRRIAQVLEPALQELQVHQRAVYERLQLEPSQEAAVDAWLAELATYQSLLRELHQSETLLFDRRAALAGSEELLAWDSDVIARRLEEERSMADQRDQWSEQIAHIEKTMELAKAGHELSQALEQRAEAEAALDRARDEHAQAIVGAVLTRWVRAVSVDRARPRVFRRANELLARFTRGTLQLDLDDHASPPVFLARHGSQSARGVDRLSVGERVQLRAAGRGAFLEQDAPARLPLRLDETLGTSDDGRAGVIIDTVLDIAREGRQVFYFTAQLDEVAKWRARLEASGIDHQVIDLGRLRGGRAASATPLRLAAVDLPRPAAPGGMSHDEYGRLLEVPGLNPAAGHLDDLHVWHLTDDVELVHRLLCHHIVTWSQLGTLLEHGGAGLVAVDERTLARILAAASAVTAACEAWRVGRGRPVDREVLQDSQCVTDAFIDELSAIAQDRHGNAQQVLEALEGNQLKRWRAANTQRLREYFEEHGFLSKDAPLTPDTIRMRVLAAVACEVRDGLLSLAWIERLLGQLPS